MTSRRMYVQIHDVEVELGRARRRAVHATVTVALAIAVVAFALWKGHDAAEFHRACDAHGGIVLEGATGRVCVWAGAIIPIRSKP